VFLEKVGGPVEGELDLARGRVVGEGQARRQGRHGAAAAGEAPFRIEILFETLTLLGGEGAAEDE